jgi:WD40 repeat protein
MQVHVTCCGCSRQLRLPSEVIGSKVSCPICKAVFVTRARGDDRAEAIPVAGAPAVAPLDEADLLPLEMTSGGIPDLSLDDPPPPRDTRRVPDPEPDTAPLRMIDDDPPRRPAPPAPRRKRREEDEDDPPRRQPRDEDEEDAASPNPRVRDAEPADQPPRNRRRQGASLAAFAVFVHSDPNGRFAGRFDAEADADGLKFWRGNGRVVEVPRGAACEYLGGGRLLLLIEGRKVELTTVHPDGLHDELAREVCAYVEKRQDTVALPTRKVGPVAWLTLLPAALPLLGAWAGGVAGLVVWAAVAAALAAVTALVVTRRHWSADGRAWGASLVTLAGLLALLTFARLSGSEGPATIPAAWCPLAPIDGGFRAEVPGLPAKSQSNLLIAPWALREVYCVNVPPADTAFVVAYGDSAAAQPAEQQLAGVARDFAQQNGGTVLSQREVDLAGQKGVEFEIDSRDKGRVRGRAFSHERRLFALAFVSKRLPTSCPEAAKFLDSFALDPTTGWPGPPTPGVPAAVAVAPVPRPGVVPFQPPVPAAENPGPLGKILVKHDRPFVWCGVTSDGRRALGLAEEGAVFVFDAIDGREVGRAVVPAAARAVAASLSPDDRTLAVAGSTGSVHLVDVHSRQVKLLVPDGSSRGCEQWCVAFSPDGKQLAVGQHHGRLQRFDFPDGKAGRTVTLGHNVLRSLAWPRADLLVAGDTSRVVHLVDPGKGQATATFKAHDFVHLVDHQTMRALGLSRDLRTLVTVDTDRTIRGWDVGTRRSKFLIRQSDPQLSVAFYPSGRLFVTGSADGYVRVWDTATGRGRGIVRSRFGGPFPRVDVNGVAFTPDGKSLLTAAGPYLELWQFEQIVTLAAKDRKPLPLLPLNLQRVEVGQNGFLPSAGPLATSGDGRRVAFSGKDGRLRVWETATLNPLHEAAVGDAVPVALAPSGDLLAFGPTHDTRVRDLKTGNEFSLRATNSGRQVSALALSAGGARLAVGYLGFDGHPAEMYLWDVAAKTSRPLIGHRREVSGVAFAGDVLASVSLVDPFVRLWDLATGREFARMKGHTGGVLCVAASPDGKRLATGSQDKTARLWDAGRMREALALHGHADAVTAVAFSPDGKTVATASADKSVLLWDVGSGAELHKLTYEGTITGVGFGDKSLLVRLADGTLDRWDLEAVEALKKRPDPATPDLDKSPPPEAPDLQPAGTIAAPTALVVAPEKKCALVFTRDRQVIRYSYPDWKATRAVLTRDVVCGAALDAARGLLYAAVCEVRKVRHDARHGWHGQGDVAVFDVGALLDGKEVPGRLKPTATVPVGAPLRDLCLTDGGKFLYLLAERQQFAWQAERIDTAARKPAGAIEMPQTRVSRLRVSPDGKSLAILAVRESGPAVHLVAGIDPATAKLTKEVDLKAAAAYDLDLGNGGAAVVTCLGDVRFVRLAEGKLDARPGPLADNSPVLSPDGQRLYLARRANGSRIEAFDRGADGRFDTSKPRDALEGTGELILSYPFWMVPDARFLVGITGRLVKLSAGGVERPGPAAEPPLANAPLRELPPWREGHAGRVLAVAVSPRDGRVMTGGEDRHVLFRMPTDGAVTQKVDVEGTSGRVGGVHAVAFSRDGRASVAVSWTGYIQGDQWPGGRLLIRKQWRRPAGVVTVAFLPDNEQVAGADEHGLFVCKTRPEGPQADYHVITEATLTGVAAHHSSGLIAAGSVEGKVHLFGPIQTTTNVKGTLPGHADECRCVAFPPDGKRLISAGVDGVVRAWDVESAKVAMELSGPGSPVLSLAAAPDGKLLAVGRLDGSLHLRNLEDGKPVLSTPARPGLPLHALAFSADGRMLFGAAGALVRRWDTSDQVGPPLAPPRPAMTPITPPGPNVKPPAPPVVGAPGSRVSAHRDLVFDRKGKQAIIVSRVGVTAIRLSYPELRPQGTARLERAVFKLAADDHRDRLYALRTDRPVTAAASRGPVDADDAELLVYDLKSFRGEGRVLTPSVASRHRLTGAVRTMALSPDGESLFYLDTKGKRLVKLATGTLDKPAGELKLDVQPEAMALSPDGKSLVVGGEQSLVRIDAATLKPGLVVPLKFKPASVAISDKGHLAAAGAEGAQHWAAQFEPGRTVPSRGESRSGPVSVAFSADQKWVLVVPHVSGEGAAWSAADSAARAPKWFRIEGPASKLSAGGEFAVCPDGERLILSNGAVVKLLAEVAGAK